MKLNFSKRKTSGMTIFEVLVLVGCVFVCLVLLAAILLPYLAARQTVMRRIYCVSDLRQINIGLRIWEMDNGNQYPMAVSVTNGGAMEQIDAGDPIGCFRDISNEMITTKIFVCPNDSGRTVATNWNELNGSHISYFLSADAKEDHPETILDGDDNLAIDGVRARSGLLMLSSNSTVDWTAERHCRTNRPHFWSPSQRICVGNIGLADGSVQQLTTGQLQELLRTSDPETNRIAIP